MTTPEVTAAAAVPAFVFLAGGPPAPPILAARQRPGPPLQVTAGERRAAS